MLLCFSNTEEVCVGGMEGMRGQLIGEEIRHNRTNRSDRHTVQILAAHCNSFGFYSGNFRAEGTSNYGRLKLKRQRG